METLRQDIAYGVRTLRKNPGFTFVAILTLAISVGANTAIFSVVNSVLLRELPFRESDRLVKVWPEKYRTTASKVEYMGLRERAQSFDDLAAYSGWSFTLTGEAEPLKLSGARATASFFSLLGASAAQGRTFAPDEDQPGRHRVIVISHGFWQRHYGGDAGAVGRSVVLDGEPHTIIGVMPESFAFPSDKAEMWVPAPINPTDGNDYSAGYLDLLARLKPGVTVEQTLAEVKEAARQMRGQVARKSDNYGEQAAVRPLKDEVVGDSHLLLTVLLGAVGFVLLIACANVANLQLARMTARQKEVAIRAALGASRWRVVRQLLTESLLLALAGGAAGLLVASWGTGFLTNILPADTPRLAEVTLDGRVLAFSLGLSLLTGILFGLLPALQSSSPNLQAVLKEGGIRSPGAAGGRLRRLLVVSEIALIFILLVGAGLLLRSFWRLQQVDPGFKTENLLSLHLSPPETKYRDAARKRAFYRDVTARVAALPGVEGVGAIHILPFEKRNWNPGLQVENAPLPEGERLPSVNWRLVTPDYFAAMGVPLRSGRLFTPADNENAQKVAIINEDLARRYWPDGEPVGKRIRSGFEGKDWATVVGVVGGVKGQGLDKETLIEMYRPYDQSPFATTMVLAVRAAGDPAALAPAVREAVWSVDRDVPVAHVQPMTEVVRESLAPQRSTLLLLTVFASLALALGAVGIYGVVAYTVTQQTREIGIRLALGARPAEVLRLVLARGLRLTAGGIALGLGAAFALTRFMESLLFGVGTTDALTFASVSVVLAAVALAACFVPARRAAKTDPMIALRYE